MTDTAGSLFTGYLGLDMAVNAVFDTRLMWVSDIDPGACAILEHRAPGVPNLGDITRVDWGDVEPVDVIGGGFPCQPVSHAGRRLGDQDERWLWDDFARAIGALRPRHVVLENVRGLLSAGRGRLFGQVLGDLAAERYDARWGLLRAADVGAPHGRARVFIVASDTAGEAGIQRPRLREGEPTRLRGRRPTDDGVQDASDADDQGRQGTEPTERPVVSARGATPDAESLRRGEGWPEPTRIVGRPDASECGGATPDAGREGQDARSVGRVDGGAESHPRERQRTREVAGDRGDAATADAEGYRRGPSRHHDDQAGTVHAPIGRSDRAWGAYEPAIRRWERVLGRPAPAPTRPTDQSIAARARRVARLDPRPVGMRGSLRLRHQLDPRFVEWLMGLPDGWVTQVPGLTRNQQLKALGNGVVPQQATAALHHLLDQTATLERIPQ